MNSSFTDDVPGSASNWLSFGRTQRNHGLGATSPGVATSPHGSSAVAASPNEGNLDDASFAESYRPETSPLFNPMFMTASRSPDAAPPPGLTSNTGAWESNNRQVSPLVHLAPAQSPDLSTEADESVPLEETVVQQPVADTSRKSSPHQESSGPALLGESEVQKFVADPFRELSPLQESALRSAGENDQGQSVDEPKLDAMDTGASIKAEAEVHEATENLIVKIAERKSAELTDDGFEDVPEEEVDDAQDTRQPATTSAPEKTSAITNHVDADGTAKCDQMDIGSEGSSSNRRSSADDLAMPPPSSTKRPRRNASQMLNEAAQMFVKDTVGPRKRFSYAPASPAVKSTPISAAKRARKSMPARINAETPKKRGRPRKSEGIATPATQSVAKRGRPRKSDAVPAIKASPKTTRAAPTPRAIMNLQKTAAASPQKAAESGSAATTPNKVGRPRKTPAVETTATETTETPKRRGRPPKNTPQSSSAKPAVSGTSSRGLRSTDAELPQKRNRTVKARVVSSPAKRGRPARKAATSTTKSASAKAAPTEAAPTKTIATRGRRAATKTASDDVAEAIAPVDPPKRRGRPPKNPAAKESVTEPVAKRRGRGATATEEPPVAETRKRGRPAQSAAEDDTPPVVKTRGRPKRSEPKAEAPEPPTKRQRTTRAAEEQAAPTRRTGRSTAKEATEKTAVSSRAKSTRSQPETAPAEAEPPKVTRGRGAAKLAVEKSAPAPAPKPRGRPPKSGKSGKGELPSSKAAAEKQTTKRKTGRGAGSTGVVKKSSEPVATRRGLRSRG
ncbi:hypothetical protein QQX98_011234 [Neonectria punicea]|uniref:AT hook domain-containing protein n=1 Tax=Neonectria punicea TaxID=979145 RepID=A0ABR1GMM2_9HYPO